MQADILIGNSEFFKEGAIFLSNQDKDWKKLVSKVGPCVIPINQSILPFQALIKSVIYQQLHPKAASSILKKFIDFFDGRYPSPTELIAKKQGLKECGLSKNKCVSIVDIALYQKYILPNYTDVKNIKNEDIIAKLITLKGVGRWTAEMFLIFHLGRLDIMPSTDLAIRNQYKKLKSLKEDISPQQLTLATKPLSPFRSIAAWYLWQSTSNAS